MSIREVLGSNATYDYYKKNKIRIKHLYRHESITDRLVSKTNQTVMYYYKLNILK